MDEKATTPYPERTKDIILLVCEPATEYGKTIVYQGATITNALKDYYSFITNREKIDVLKWIVAQPAFTELKRLSTTENKIFTLYTDQYDEILKTGEMPNNLQIAQKFVSNGYDVFLLSNPKATKSADFIIRQKNKVFYVEGKTSSGGSSLTTRLNDGAKQANRIAINLTSVPKIKSLATDFQTIFYNNPTLKELFVFKGSVMIRIDKFLVCGKKFEKNLCKEFSRKK